MQKESDFNPKPLDLNYQEFDERGATIQNLVIDKYVVYDMIGMGSYGSVYRGMNEETKKEVAIKLINMRQIQNQTNKLVRQIKLRLAQSQPRLMYMCNSPYLLKCYDVYQNQDLKVLIIQYCNGKTLQAEIQEKKRIPENQAWIILKHIINGLMGLHNFKIVHRDLKAQNIMSHNGTYKIIDFGFSKKLQIAQESSQIRNTSLGTITTMAPQVMGRKPYGLKADIWSLGIIFFQMIYGVYPYDSSTAPQMYRQIQSKKLFSKEEPLTFNGYTPSQEAFDFLRFTLKIQTDRRPDWRAVADYPNIKNIKDSDLSQRFLQQCQVVVTQDLDYRQQYVDRGAETTQKIQTGNQKVQKKQDQSFRASQEERPLFEDSSSIKKEEKKQVQKEQKKQVQKEQKKQEKRQQKKQERKKEEKVKEVVQKIDPVPRKQRFNLEEVIKKEKQIENIMKRQQKQSVHKIRESLKKPIIRAMSKDQAQRKEKEVNKEQDQQFKWTQIAHLQCVKTQFVFREIIYPLAIIQQMNTDRSSIQFYYLLAARCFNNMSPVRQQLQRYKEKGLHKEIIANLNNQITRLYNQVQKKFIDFSSRLTQTQNKMGSMFKDWFSKRLSKDQFQNKDRFLTGIQKIQYTKQQQIKFTFDYFTKEMKTTMTKAKNLNAVIRRLDNYQTIMNVKLEYLKAKAITFEQFVNVTIGNPS